MSADIIISRRNRNGLATATIHGVSSLGAVWLSVNLQGVKDGIVVVSDEGVEDLIDLMGKCDLIVEVN